MRATQVEYFCRHTHSRCRVKNVQNNSFNIDNRPYKIYFATIFINCLLEDRFPKVFYHFVDFSVEILYSEILYNYKKGFNEHVHDPYLAFILKALTSLNTVMIHRFFIVVRQSNHLIQLLDVNALLY